MIQKILKSILFAVVAVLVGVTIAHAGSVTPPGSPSASMYTLDDIYTKLINNTDAGSHTLSTSTSPASTFHTLSQIYGAVPTVDPTKVLSGTSYLGITGTLVPSGGTASTSDVFNGLTFFGTSQTDWNTHVGTLNLACNTNTFDGTANLVADAYDGGGNGTNRWCMTDSGTASTSDILSGKIAWINGQSIIGTIPLGSNISGANGSTTLTIPNGYYSGKTVTAHDNNLLVGNIANGVSIFGVTGTLAAALGNAGAGDVLSGKTFSTSTATNVSGTIPVKSGEVASIVSATSSNKILLTAPIGYYDGTVTLSTTSANFIASNIKSGTTIFGLTGSLAGGYTYGDSDPSKVLTTAAGAGTYVGINYSLWNLQTKDDWVNSAGTVGEYTAEEGPWTQVVGSPFAGYNAINFSGSNNLISGKVYMDNRTGLLWSDMMAIGSTASTTDNSFTLSADGVRPTGGSAIGFCNALNAYNSGAGFAGYNNWYLPTQKQLMQAYIGGFANNAPNPGNGFWSSTEYYSNAANAWTVYLYNGNTYSTTKTTMYYVRCVR